MAPFDALRRHREPAPDLPLEWALDVRMPSGPVRPEDLVRAADPTKGFLSLDRQPSPYDQKGDSSYVEVYFDGPNGAPGTYREHHGSNGSTEIVIVDGPLTYEYNRRAPLQGATAFEVTIRTTEPVGEGGSDTTLVRATYGGFYKRPETLKRLVLGSTFAHDGYNYPLERTGPGPLSMVHFFPQPSHPEYRYELPIQVFKPGTTSPASITLLDNGSRNRIYVEEERGLTDVWWESFGNRLTLIQKYGDDIDPRRQVSVPLELTVRQLRRATETPRVGQNDLIDPNFRPGWLDIGQLFDPSYGTMLQYPRS